jgi:hypothetical protein
MEEVFAAGVAGQIRTYYLEDGKKAMVSELGVLLFGGYAEVSGVECFAGATVAGLYLVNYSFVLGFLVSPQPPMLKPTID